jgi:predicted phosphodiesterase
MRYLVLTDIHANLEALDACLADSRARGFDRTLVLGDVVGYGPDPSAVVERVQSLEPTGVVRGNHDKVASGLEQPEGFNVIARNAALWTFYALSPEHRGWLAAMPKGPQTVDDVIEICHGSPVDEDAYIFDELDALRALRVAERPLCLFGHTHYPVAFEQGPATDSVDVIALARSPQLEITLPARRLRDRRQRPPGRRAVPLALPSRDHSGQDHQGGPARDARAAAGGRTVTESQLTFPSDGVRRSSRRFSSTAKASRAARAPRIHPMMMPISRTDGMKMK